MMHSIANVGRACATAKSLLLNRLEDENKKDINDDDDGLEFKGRAEQGKERSTSYRRQLNREAHRFTRDLRYFACRLILDLSPSTTTR